MSKGQKVTCNGVFLTNKEYGEYKKILEMIDTFRTYKKDYNLSYKEYYM